MAHTHSLLLYHIVFSTKHRRPMLTAQVRALVFPYMCGIVERVGGKVLIANGVEDHVHMLCSLKPQHAVAEVVKTLKGASSAWFNREAGKGTVHWQDGYGAFTVSLSQKDATYAYIAAQEEHHRTRTFAEEYEAFLVRHGIDFDPRFHLD